MATALSLVLLAHMAALAGVLWAARWSVAHEDAAAGKHRRRWRETRVAASPPPLVRR